ncbi:hypothetical protein PVAP13_3NG311306 [Panicum virgatum]|uniref:Uncharacterized protein n=1 Tax=Panicum virgatum TaxID=38727 RepID=A0A8T0UL17_PANVG|nr:hypothetical protein PVAP13_3NG311306 [Panicum virgatum]
MRLQPSQDVALGISEGAFGQAVYLPELTELVIYYNTSQLGMKTHFVCKRKGDRPAILGVIARDKLARHSGQL